MSRRARRSKVNQTGRCGANKDFVLLHWWTLRSPAFRSLSGNAVKVLLDIWDKHKGPNHNGSIGYGVRDGAELGLSKDQTARALEELVAKGFLAVTREAAFGTKRISRRWRLTAEPTAAEPATKEFMAWTGPAPAVEKSPKTRARREPVAHDKPIRAPARIFDSRTSETDSRTSATMGGRGTRSEAPTVAPARLSEPPPQALQSHQRDSLRSTTPKGFPGHSEGLQEGLVAGGPCGHVDNPAAADPELEAVFRKAQPHFGRAVAELRERRRIGLDELASRIEVNAESWARVESGVQPARGVKQRARQVLHEMNGHAHP